MKPFAEGARPMARLLLVDDDYPLLDQLSAYLRGQGHEVTTAVSGFAALSAAQTWEFDVAIVDREMPGMDGVETVERLKELCPRLLVVLLSAYNDVCVPGARACVTKDLSPSALLALVDALARSKEGGGGVAASAKARDER